MSNGKITLTRRDSVAEILIERPEKLNALTVEMLELLNSAVLELDADSDIRAVILWSAGERAFCVGADINSWAEYKPLDMWRSWVKQGHRVFDALAGLRQPVIAVVQGPALGGGFELALAADLRVADENACFGLPESGIATCPGWSGSQRLVSLINPSLVKELIFTGRTLSARRALELGVVNEVAEPGCALQNARALATEICAKAPVSVQLSKQMVDAGNGDRAAMIIEAMAGGLAAMTEDAREGVLSFRERRQPEFIGE